MSATQATAEGALISATGLCVRFQGAAVLDDVSVSLQRGEIVSLIGPNGSGKTTLVRALLGLQATSSGRIERAPGLAIGYVPQNLHIEPTMPISVRRFLKLTYRRRRGDWSGVLDEVGAGHLLDRPMQSLSGGENRRVLLAAALLREPDLLVLDEATAGMDVSGQSQFYGQVRRIRDERQCAILLVSHELHLVMAATDFVLCLNTHVCCSGHPEAVTQHPAYIELFGAESARQLALYQHDLAHHEHHHVHREDTDGAEHSHG